MKNDFSLQNPQSFLFSESSELSLLSLFKLNLYLNDTNAQLKPYQIDYNILMLSYRMWKGKDLEEFCEKQTLSYFLFNPHHDSAEAREALFMEIREFLMGN